ncbi:transcriptional regulator [Lysobacter pythonis]|uniref:Transcriptional regulator n=1 Tax=Solilutibacter pythonis TaxID=2483112 RepID=A0A3M2HJY2_9GAMM|nr:transcriptional regulator [Lysobacter pythonis]RMH87900.1 transcriptional regulator [Lysobacter pythonis]
MDREKAEFAERLRAALKDAGIEPSASLLEKRFNSRYEGAPVTAQAISGWLSGRYLPKQDKIRVLAAIVGMEPHVLQYGGALRVAEPKLDWQALSPADSAMFDTFLSLPATQRRLVRELVAELAAKDPGR